MHCSSAEFPQVPLQRLRLLHCSLAVVCALLPVVVQVHVQSHTLDFLDGQHIKAQHSIQALLLSEAPCTSGALTQVAQHTSQQPASAGGDARLSCQGLSATRLQLSAIHPAHHTYLIARDTCRACVSGGFPLLACVHGLERPWQAGVTSPSSGMHTTHHVVLSGSHRVCQTQRKLLPISCDEWLPMHARPVAGTLKQTLIHCFHRLQVVVSVG